MFYIVSLKKLSDNYGNEVVLGNGAYHYIV